MGYGLEREKDKQSMLKLLRLLDRVVGYAYIPRPSAAAAGGTTKMTEEEAIKAYPLPQLTGVQDVADVQEKWVDNRSGWEEWEAAEQKERQKERRAGGKEGSG